MILRLCFYFLMCCSVASMSASNTGEVIRDNTGDYNLSGFIVGNGLPIIIPDGDVATNSNSQGNIQVTADTQTEFSHGLWKTNTPPPARRRRSVSVASRVWGWWHFSLFTGFTLACCVTLHRYWKTSSKPS